MFPVIPRCPKCRESAIIKEAVGDEKYRFECLDCGRTFEGPLGFMDILKELERLTSTTTASS